MDTPRTVPVRRSHISFSFLLAFLTTTFVLQWAKAPVYPLWLWLLVGMMIILPAAARLQRSILMIAALLGIALALSNVARTTHITDATSIESFASGSDVSIEGTIIAEPDRRPMQTKYTIAADNVRVGTGKIMMAKGNVLITDMAGWPEFAYGDRVIVYGELERPGTFDTFSYDNYLSIQDIYAVMQRAYVEKIGTSSSSPIIASLFTLKERFEHQINRIYPEPHASFLAGLLTGSRKGIPEHLLDDFSVVGLTHIIAISGYNITIIIAIVSGLLFWLPLKWRFVPLISGIALFTIFVGASPSVIRAAIMGILGLVALQAGRQTQSRLLIAWAACFMVLWKPAYLWYDAGFQLSFLAVIGLAELSPWLGKKLQSVPDTAGIRTALEATIAAHITTLPLIIFLFRRISFIAPLANIIAAPFIPLAMLFGFLGTTASYLWFPAGQAVAYLGWGCLQIIIFTAHMLSALPFAAVNI